MTDSDEVKLLPCPRDPEADAWDWLDSKWLNIEAGHDPNDRDYSADEMVGAFMAGQAHAEATRPPVVTDEVVERLALALGAALKRRCGDRAWADEKRCVAEDTILAEVDGEIDLLDLARAAIASMPAVVSGGQGDD